MADARDFGHTRQRAHDAHDAREMHAIAHADDHAHGADARVVIDRDALDVGVGLGFLSGRAADFRRPSTIRPSVGLCRGRRVHGAPLYVSQAG